MFHDSRWLQYYTLDCYPGEICTQTIPIEAGPDLEVGRPSLVTHSESDFGTSNEIEDSIEADEDEDRKFIPNTENRINSATTKLQNLELPAATKAPTRFTMGPSVASVFGVNGLGPHYPVTKHPKETRDQYYKTLFCCDILLQIKILRCSVVVAHFTKRFLPTLEDQGSNIITIFFINHIFGVKN